MVFSKWHRYLLISLPVLLKPAIAHAHLVNSRFGDFYGGLFHPLTALEHILPMIALGLLAGQQGTAKARKVLFVFPLSLMLGVILALYYPSTGFPNIVNMVSFLVLGGLVAAAWALPEILLICIAGFFGLTHGYANGTAITSGMSVILFSSGIVTSGMIVVSLCPAIVVSLKASWTRIAVRVAGSWITAIGFMMIGLGLKQ